VLILPLPGLMTVQSMRPKAEQVDKPGMSRGLQLPPITVLRPLLTKLRRAPCFLIWLGEGRSERVGIATAHLINHGPASLPSIPGMPTFLPCFFGKAAT